MGYPNKEKHRVWIAGVSLSEFTEVDKFGTECKGLVTDLLELLFKSELLMPEDYCCTQIKGKTLFNQELLRGIRRKF